MFVKKENTQGQYVDGRIIIYPQQMTILILPLAAAAVLSIPLTQQLKQQNSKMNLEHQAGPTKAPMHPEKKAENERTTRI